MTSSAHDRQALQPTRDAATVVIVRDRDDAPAELLMVRRSGQMRFAGGAMVFPGGAVDEADRDFAASLVHDLTVEEAAMRIAAIRESVEEVGVAIGLPDISHADISDVRAMLHAGQSLEQALRGSGVTPALDALTPFARWRPNHPEVRVFDTRFYLSAIAPDAPEPTADATENEALCWISAADMLARADRGEAQIIFPTRRNLERLAQFPDYQSLRRHALSIPVRTITPWIEERDGRPHLCIDQDMGYPTCAEPLENVRRG